MQIFTKHIRLITLITFNLLLYLFKTNLVAAQMIVPTPIVDANGQDVYQYEYANSSLDLSACQNANSSSFCAGTSPAPSNLCTKSTIIDDNIGKDYFTVQVETSQAVNSFSFLVVNEQNQNKPVCTTQNPGGYACPAGSSQLVVKANYSDPINKINIRIKYSDIIVNDFNNNQSLVGNLLVKTFVSTPGVSGGAYSAENANCNLKLSYPQIPYDNYYPEINNYLNLGRFRKVGEWTVDMTSPVANTPVSSNYLYDSYDTEWKVKTDTPLHDSKFGCYKLINGSYFDITYLGYLDENGKYLENTPLFSSEYIPPIPPLLNFVYQVPGTDLNGNIILNPSPFPNCVNTQTIDAYKTKVNQPGNLINPGIEVSMKTKFKLKEPSNFEDIQHVFKATDLACNTSVSEPGGAGTAVPENWISTDGGTVYYSQSLADAKSPVAPSTKVKIDSNLYCTYDYNTPTSSKIYYKDANSDDSLLAISKSLLFNDIVGKSFSGAKVSDYMAGDDLLLQLLGDSSSHFTTFLNQVKSQARMVTLPTNATTILNNITQTGCNIDDDRCYIEINGDTVINGDDGLPQIDNYFCDRNAMFFIDGDLTINNNIYKSDNINSCCGFIVSGNINFAADVNNNYNKTRYQTDYLTRNDVDWYNTYECATGFYYSEGNISIQPDNTQSPLSSTEVNLSDPLMLRGDLLAKGNIQQGRTNGIGNLSRPAVYLTKDTCIMNNFPELSHVLLQTRERDFDEAN